MSITPKLPLVLLPACNRGVDARDFHCVPVAYSDALRMVGGQPLLVPGIAPGEFEALLKIADGILLPGSPNNVHPSHFSEEVLDPALPLDPKRDALTLPLIRAAIERGIPILGICRGHQEINVALGGSLHQAVHLIPGKDNHQPFADAGPDLKYGPAHDVAITRGGLLDDILGMQTITVNSIHGQAINQLAPGLRIEALASDGVIEAITLPTAPGFNLGLQWHPEWQAAGNPVSFAIFQAFAAACRSFRNRKR